MEPSGVSRYYEEMQHLKISEENEVHSHPPPRRVSAGKFLLSNPPARLNFLHNMPQDFRTFSPVPDNLAAALPPPAKSENRYPGAKIR